MSTRVTNAVSKRAKATLIELLFPRHQAKRYSHLQLRKAYLQKVHIMHPDKQCSSSSSSTRGDQAAHEKFVQLQNAWEAYNVSARMFRQTTHTKSKQGDNDDDDENDNDFTLFGVGCSFSDSPEERKLRDEIMDQACRGWFPSGTLSRSDGEKTISKEVKSPQQSDTKLSDDDMFVQQFLSEESTDGTSVYNDNVQMKKSLVQDLMSYRNKISKKR
mmetsp:Transcript_19961/g.31156  ORF Transcript_19961/g.31156 Transcript_19961/m.31156 type:complete len:216 (+) Transcript_19961:71-718(+)